MKVLYESPSHLTLVKHGITGYNGLRSSSPEFDTNSEEENIQIVHSVILAIQNGVCKFATDTGKFIYCYLKPSVSLRILSVDFLFRNDKWKISGIIDYDYVQEND